MEKGEKSGIVDDVILSFGWHAPTRYTIRLKLRPTFVPDFKEETPQRKGSDLCNRVYVGVVALKGSKEA
jgi:hypothetical protein